MKRGPKPQPAVVRLARANPSKKPIPVEPECEILNEYIPPPETVLAQPNAREVWEETLPRLIAMGIMSNNDLKAFENYCVACGIHAEAVILMSKTGLTYESVNEAGGILSRKSPFIEIINTSSRLIIQFSSEFGLTPASRARLGSVGVGKKTGGIEDFIS